MGEEGAALHGSIRVDNPKSRGGGKFIGPMIGAILISIVQGVANLMTSLSGSSNSAGFVAFSRWLGENSKFTPFLTAAVLLVVDYLLPAGLTGIPETIRSRRAKRAEKREIAEMMQEGGAAE